MQLGYFSKTGGLAFRCGAILFSVLGATFGDQVLTLAYASMQSRFWGSEGDDHFVAVPCCLSVLGRFWWAGVAPKLLRTQAVLFFWGSEGGLPLTRLASSQDAINTIWIQVVMVLNLALGICSVVFLFGSAA